MLVRCQTDATLRSLATRVVAVDGDAVELEDTVLFPTGGGQPCDRGRLVLGDGRALEVVDVVRHKDERVLHRVADKDAAAGVAAGAEVTAEVDWARRMDHMQQHSGQHLLSALAEQRFGAKTVGWGLLSTECYVDLSEELGAEQLEALEAAINDEIRAARPIVVHNVPRDEAREMPGMRDGKGLDAVPAGSDVRVVAIGGVDANACCGTHLPTTAAAQACKLLRKERAKGNMRLYFVFGERVLRHLAASLERDRELNRLLACAPNQFADLVGKAQQELKAATKTAKSLSSELGGFLAEQALACKGPLFSYTNADAPPSLAQDLARTMRKKRPELALVVVVKGAFVVAGPADWVAQAGPAVCEALGGKGGGRGDTFTGKLQNLPKDKAIAEAVDRATGLFG